MPSRITLSRAKGWRKPEGARVVTRSTIFGNPWAVGTDNAFWWPHDPRGPRWISSHRIPAGKLTPEQAVAQFAAWLYGYAVPREMRPDNLTREGHRVLWDALAVRRIAILGALSALRGRDLGCWCAPGCACHADILLVFANAAHTPTALDLSRFLELADHA
jgi:hypothetical protein